MKRLLKSFGGVIVISTLVLSLHYKDVIFGTQSLMTRNIVAANQFPSVHQIIIKDNNTLINADRAAAVPAILHRIKGQITNDNVGAKVVSKSSKDSPNGGRFRDYIPAVPVGSAEPRIPHIIHQTWDDENVPVMFSSYIASWTKYHPDWEYWFWTPKEVEVMLKTHYPEYLKLYGNYSEAIFKANLMRYFIMHQYGGVYADLDLESLRPLDNWTMDNDCIMSQNHYVHAYIVGDRAKSEVMITFLASRPGHPYFKKAIDMLPSYRDMPYNEKLVYAEKVYIEYMKTDESKQPGNSVTVTHPDYFLPTYDKGWAGKVRKMCFTLSKSQLTPKQAETCAGVKDGTLGRAPKPFSYANHYWEHVIMWGKGKERKPRIQIHDIIPKVQAPRI